MKVSKCVAIIGAGQMGCGIAELFIRNGFTALLTDLNASVLQRGIFVIIFVCKNLRSKDFNALRLRCREHRR